jgi:MraZ protein
MIDPSKPQKSRERRTQTVLTGEFKHSIDAKNRMFVPAKLREELGETFMIACDIREKCLKVYSLEGWEKYIEPIKNLPREIAEQALRFLHRTAAQVSPDSQGRILLTSALVEHAQIEKGAVVVGCSDYAEIWAEANYQAKIESEDIEQLRRVLEGYGL